MAGVMYVPNLDSCKVVQKDSGKVFPLISCPGYWELVKTKAAVTTYLTSKLLPTPPYGVFACSTYIFANDLGLPDSVTVRIPFAEVDNGDPMFKQHVREGHIIVNERQIGEVTCVSTGGYKLGSRTVGEYSRGWFRLSEIGFSATITDQQNPAVGILIAYDKVTLPSRLPAPDLFNQVFGEAVDGVLPSALVDPAPDVATVTRALADANSGQYDLLTEMAELPETLGFLKSTIQSMLVLGDKYDVWTPRKGPVRLVTEELASLWLAYRYAVMPLIYSFQDIKSTLTDCKRLYAEYKQKEMWTIDPPIVSGFNATSSVTVIGRAFVKRKYDPMGLIDKILSCLQINPFVTAFEITKFSFVLGWFLNISDSILAFTGNSDCSEQASTWSNRTSGAFDYVEEGGTRRAFFVVEFYHRVPIDPVAHSGLAFTAQMNWKRTLDSMSLGFLRLSSEIMKRKYKK